MSIALSFVSPAIAWGMGAAVVAVFCEYLYKVLPGPWWHYIWLWAPLQTAVGYGVYRLVTIPNTSLLDAFILWSFSTMFTRIVVSVFVLGETVKTGTWYALVLLVMARIAQTYWGK
jgi:hypothetical protein